MTDKQRDRLLYLTARAVVELSDLIVDSTSAQCVVFDTAKDALENFLEHEDFTNGQPTESADA